MTVHFFRTTNKNDLFQEVTVEKTSNHTDVLSLDSAQYGQTIDGFGASFTDSSAFLVDEVIDEKEKVMQKLFDPKEGIGLSILRNPMGASDYARTIYSYDDQVEGKTDLNLKHFSINHDRKSILPLTKWAQALNPELKVFASPWSAPGWMKDSQKMVTGRLQKEYYPVYAQYFVKFIEAYQKEDVPIYAVTPQNEPLYEPENYPGMFFPAKEEATFVQSYLKPALKKAGLQTKIFGYDHNWDRVDYPFELLDRAYDAFDGIAWHWYGGFPASQSRVSHYFSEKEIHFTEGSGGDWIPAFEPAFSNLICQGIEILRHGSKSFVLWNIALDEKNGPTVPNFGRSTCRGLIAVNQKTKAYEYTLDYYGLAHFSKYIRPGAKRIVTKQTKSLKNVAFKNLDDSLVVVLFNDSSSEKKVLITDSKKNLGIMTLPAKSAGTFFQSNKTE